MLREMRKLPENRITDELLRDLFLKRLPEPVRVIIAASGVKDPEMCGATADKAIEYARPAHIRAVSTKSTHVPTLVTISNDGAN